MEEKEIAVDFNKQISISVKCFPVDICLHWIQNNNMDISIIDRKKGWTKKQKSLLLESIMLGIPIPAYYSISSERGVLSIVDGRKRLSAIKEFVNDKSFALQGLEILKQYENLKYNQLPYLMQNIINRTEFHFTIINPGTSEKIKEIIVNRIKK